MEIQVQFFSYFKDLAGCARTEVKVETGVTLGALHNQLMKRFPKLEGTRRSTLLAVGVEYQTHDYILREGDEVSLFPPVQGG
jgi:molybdopterin converting factor small subunit